MAILAVQTIRKMRGGSQAQLALGADGRLYVVKFQNNPQHIRVLANELIVARLAEWVGLSVPATEVIEVTPWLAANMGYLELGGDRGCRERYAPGCHFGSRFVGGLMPGQVVDYLPGPQLEKVRNLDEFAGMLALDKWTCNCDARQAVFSRTRSEKRYKATFIDHGFCFNAGEWNFPDAPLRGAYARSLVYAGVTGWDSFSPWLERLEEMPSDVLYQLIEDIPPEWYDDDPCPIGRLVENLLSRRSRIRELILSFRNSDRNPFPCWVGSSTAGAVRRPVAALLDERWPLVRTKPGPPPDSLAPQVDGFRP